MFPTGVSIVDVLLFTASVLTLLVIPVVAYVLLIRTGAESYTVELSSDAGNSAVSVATRLDVTGISGELEERWNEESIFSSFIRRIRVEGGRQPLTRFTLPDYTINQQNPLDRAGDVTADFFDDDEDYVTASSYRGSAFLIQVMRPASFSSFIFSQTSASMVPVVTTAEDAATSATSGNDPQASSATETMWTGNSIATIITAANSSSKDESWHTAPLIASHESSPLAPTVGCPVPVVSHPDVNAGTSSHEEQTDDAGPCNAEVSSNKSG